MGWQVVSEAGKTLCKISQNVVAKVMLCLATGVSTTLSLVFKADLWSFSHAGAIVGVGESL